MIRFARPIRLLICAVLIVGTSGLVLRDSVAGITARSPRCVERQAQPTDKFCCCGTADGSCCGKTCCLKQSSEEAPVAPPARRFVEKQTDQTSCILAFAFANQRLVVGGFDATQSDFPHGLLAVSTLQAQRVRIQT